MRDDCIAGEREGWYEFVRDYGSIARRLLAHYFPTLATDMDPNLVAVFERARANNAEWFRGLKFQNEREFAMSFRELVFAYARIVARVPTPQISLDQMREIMRDLNVVEREVLWLFVKGYTAEQIAPMMMNAEATAGAVKGVADERLTKVIPGAGADSFTISARVLMEEAEKTKSDQCVSLKTFNNVINGQISWRERELTEQHIQDCFYCIDRFTGFQEMIRLRKDEKPLPDEAIEPVLRALGFAEAKKKGLLSRILAR